MIGTYGHGIIIDPGIGFGKIPQQSLDIVHNIEKLLTMGCRVMVGHSRKSFLALIAEQEAGNRDEETLILSSSLIRKGVDYLRVHDVAGHVALRQRIKSEVAFA